MVFGPSNCTTAPREAASDAGVAGAGVLLSFIITAALAFILSAYIIVTEARRTSESRIARKLLLSFSDQQIITGIGIQSVGLAKLETMVPYHFFLIWMLSSISTATHSASLLALFSDLKRDWVLRWLRQGLMLVNLLLSVVYGVLVLRTITTRIAPTLAIGCAWHGGSSNSHTQTSPRADATLSIVGTVAVMAGNVAVFAMAVWYLHAGATTRWLTILRAASMALLVAIAAGAASRVVSLAQAFGGRPGVVLADAGERDWSFGQLLPLLLLLLPLMSVVEIARGEMQVPAPVVPAADDDQLPLCVRPTAAERGIDFQPNPFFNSRGRREK